LSWKEFKASENKEQKNKKIKKLDNTKKISTFAIPNTGSYQTEFDNGIKKIETLII